MQKILAFLKKIAPAFIVLFFLVAVRIFYFEIKGTSFTELWDAFAQIPNAYILLSFFAVICSYGLLTLNEYMGVRECAGGGVAYPEVARTSFISNAIGFNIGAAMFSGGSIRYSLYLALGLEPVQVGLIIAFAQTSAILGTITLNGAILLFWPAKIFVQIDTQYSLRYIFGALFFCAPAAAFLLSFRAQEGKVYSILGYKVPIPAPKILITQLMVGFIRPFFTALILFALLPHAEIGYISFCGVFTLSALVGNMSMIPSGLGVFDAALVWMLTPFYDKAELISALVLYRFFYFILPLTVGLVSLLIVKGRTKYLDHEAKKQAETSG